MKSNSCFLLLGLSLLLLLTSCGPAEPAATTTEATEPPIAAKAPLPTDTPLSPAEPLAPPAASWPTRRHWHSMAYDPQAGRVLLFNGFDHKFGAGRVDEWRREGEKSLARDEWAYDVTQNRWEVLGTVPYSFLKATAYDQQSQRVVAFGQDGTMIYNLETRAWEKTEPAEELSHNRLGSALAYDSQSDRLILFGGYPELDDTWAYDYETNTWTEMSPEVSPPHRADHAMSYDAESDRIILWGAREVERAPMTEEEKATIWAYDYDADTWTAIESSGGPSYRSGHKMVYHPGSDRIILFGGYSLGEVYFCDDSWAYDYNANTWTQLAPATHPSGRWYHQMVYDLGADKIVLFGGMAGNFVREEVSDELWIFDPVAEEWSQVTPDSLNP